MVTLLYVDDDEANRLVFAETFKPRYAVSVCASGVEALDHVRRAPPEVIVADQRMPGMTGVELLEQVREISPATRRLMLTAYDDVEIMRHNGSGMCGCIEHHFMKPFDRAELAGTIESVLSERLTDIAGAVRATVAEYDRIFAEAEERREVLLQRLGAVAHSVGAFEDR